MIESQSNSWGKDIEEALERLRIICLLRSKYHKNNYFKMLSLLKYFRIPIIILSSASSVFNVALIPYMAQEYLSLLCCFISLFVGLIGSIELFLQVQKRMETDLLNAKDFYLVSIDICKILNLDRERRNCNGRVFLDEKFSSYRHLVETSIITDKDVHDNIMMLALIDNSDENKNNIIIDKNISIANFMDMRIVKKQDTNFIESIQYPISTAASRRTSFEKILKLKAALGSDDFFNDIELKVVEMTKNKNVDVGGFQENRSENHRFSSETLSGLQSSDIRSPTGDSSLSEWRSQRKDISSRAEVADLSTIDNIV
jgi:hypothetical protein